MTGIEQADLPKDAGGVVFDLDGTLYTISGLGFHISMGLLTALGPLRPLFRVRSEMRSSPYSDRETFKRVFAEKLGGACGRTAEEALDWYENRFMRRFTAVLGKRGVVRPGLVALLETLRGRGLRLGVVSDFGWVEERLDALGIPTALFDAVEAAENFGVMKPSPVPFVRLAEQWGIAPEQLVLVGDRADHDLGSARLFNGAFVGIENKKNVGERFYPWETVSEMLCTLGQPM